MPDHSGYSLIRKIRALPPKQGRNVPAIALTAYATEPERNLALKNGFQLHVAKPIDPKELVAIVAKLAKGKIL